jgi:hypothetical protein
MIVSMNFSSTKTDDAASLTICPLPPATHRNARLYRSYPNASDATST